MQSAVFRRVLLAADHAGVHTKSHVVSYLEDSKDYFGINAIVDCGPFDPDVRTDYPIYAKFVAESIQDEETCAILFCARGIGMSIAANRFPHIRAALCADPGATFFARSHSDANILVLSSHACHSHTTLEMMLKTFLTTNFSGGRYQQRLSMIDHIRDDV